MFAIRFNHVVLESLAVHLPPNKVTSRELEGRLAPLYERLGIPIGTLEKLTGVKARHFWNIDVPPSQVATVAAHKALEQIKFDRDRIQALINCSITRDFFEPATACIVHHELGLKEGSFVFDVTNACIGFVNGMNIVGNLIESGVIKAGLVVSGEANTKPVEHCIGHILKNPEITREELIKLLPTLTLGSGAVAAVLCHESIATSGHKLLGSAARAGTEHHKLCSGNGDFYFFQPDEFNPIMTTEANKLIASAAKVGGRVWKDFTASMGWDNPDVDHVFCHQVGKPLGDAFYAELGIDNSKEFTIYRDYGNQTSAAVPTCLALGVEARQVKAGEKILLLGFGSGINAMFTGLEW